ncbi:MAG: patatin-like phospholipase family protein, partial [Deltaproteobacteria bacterium]|nr:patatin-like phospholipase family protein [Deltaproteobacteria bacterium]
MHWSLPRLLAAALALAAAPPSAAADAAAAPAPRRAASFTVSGGSALGSYQAGFLYYMLAARQVNGGGGPRLKLASGASAGSINAMLSLTFAEGGLPLDPDENLFARVWLPVGFRDLFVPGAVTPLGAFSRQVLLRQALRVEEALGTGLPPTLDVVLAVTVTRVTPRHRPIAAGRATVPRTAERFLIRIQGRGQGLMPRITNYAAEDREEEQVLLPEDAGGEIPFERLASLMVASAAFPVAFAPERLAHCVVSTRGKPRPWCPESAAREDLFVDGGVFDNTPLRVAAWVAAAGLRPAGGELRWLDAPLHDDPRPPDDVDFGFLSAEARAYPTEGEARRAFDDGSLPLLLEEQLASFVASARSKELDTMVSENPRITEGLLFPQRHWPAASEPLAAFFGFFERSFRSYDFTLGMFEARRSLLRNPVARTQVHDGGRSLVLPEEAPGAVRRAEAREPSHPPADLDRPALERLPGPLHDAADPGQLPGLRRDGGARPATSRSGRAGTLGVDPAKRVGDGNGVRGPPPGRIRLRLDRHGIRPRRRPAGAGGHPRRPPGCLPHAGQASAQLRRARDGGCGVQPGRGRRPLPAAPQCTLGDVRPRLGGGRRHRGGRYPLASPLRRVEAPESADRHLVGPHAGGAPPGGRRRV